MVSGGRKADGTIGMKKSLSLIIVGFALVGKPSLAQTAVSTPMVAAPLPQVSIAAPVSRHCRLFETCANTKIGLGKGDFLVRLSAIGLMPNDRTSTIWLNDSIIDGRVKTTRQAAPELTFEYFITDHLSIDAIAASTRHEIAAEDTVFGKIDLGGAWVLPPTVTLAWHFRPHKRFNPYAGIGGTLAFFHNVSADGGGPLGLAQKLNVGTTGGPSVNIGFDYQIVGNWFFNMDAKQIFMRAHVWTSNTAETVKVRAHDSLDPTVVGMGVAYRF